LLSTIIRPSAAYKQDFKDYLLAYNDLKEYRHKPVLSWYNLYIRMLFAMQDSIPGVSLLTLSREQIAGDALPCRTVAAAVEAGLLPPVPEYARWDSGI
jgi:hypothetical protein